MCSGTNISKFRLALVLEVLKDPTSHVAQLLCNIAGLKLLCNYVSFSSVDQGPGLPPPTALGTPATKKPQDKPPASGSSTPGRTRAMTKTLDDIYKQAVKTVRSENGISVIVRLVCHPFYSRCNWNMM